ncbi:MAG TPA: thiamine pyrophosphate-binding protein, partial [Candidatus Limnocylindrales bacterium]|nr:thiamine pyrophosphate-binding protein [Candidatus Limnocylindrales bacterium]
MNNSDLIVRTLEQAGVRWVFGIPSGPVLPLIEALRQSSVAFVLTATETSAAFMASAVGYLTGVPGVCVSTLGPGATNLTTGVGSAWLDRAPLLAITCNIATTWLRRRIQMRIDHHKLFEPLTKASLACRQGNVGEMFAQAIGIAIQEPPGPVHLDLPEDVAQALALEARSSRITPTMAADLSTDAATAVAAALNSAKRPLLITGLTFTRSA